MNKKYYKGFDKDLKCRDFQFEVEKTSRHDGEVKVCEGGFHSCAEPFDVLRYYGLAHSRFAEVSIDGKIDALGPGTKIASEEITILRELPLSEFISVGIESLLGSAHASSRDYDNLATSAHYSKLAASGHSSELAASGNFSTLATSGYSGKLATSGTGSNLASLGDSSKLAASGNSSNLSASGRDSKLAASGNISNLSASGISSSLATSGVGSNLSASGEYSILSASGNSSNLSASGEYSILSASGNSSDLSASGSNSVAVSAGVNGTVKGGKNCAFALTYWSAKEGRFRIATAYTGENGIKEDTWYRLDKQGVFIEAE
jgi:hypothetical protein